MFRPPTIALMFLAAVSLLAGRASGQTRGPARAEPITCSPAPCILPATRGSEGGAEVTDTPIAADPINPQHLLLGSVDFNCPQPSVSGFHISSDGGSTWSRTCMPVITTSERVFWPGGQPMVGYDLNGTAYIAGEYGDSEGLGYGLVAIQKSTDGVNWSNPAISLGGPNNFELFLYASLSVDASPQSRYANSLYVSAMVLHQAGENRVVVSHSGDRGSTWSTVAVDRVQAPPAADRWTDTIVGADGTVYLTWMHCPRAAVQIRTALTARSTCYLRNPAMVGARGRSHACWPPRPMCLTNVCVGPLGQYRTQKCSLVTTPRLVLTRATVRTPGTCTS